MEPQFVVVIGGDTPTRAGRSPARRRARHRRRLRARSRRRARAARRPRRRRPRLGDPAALAAATAAGVGVDRHPTAKDATDTELALDAALARGRHRLVVVSGGGDRLDHVLPACWRSPTPRWPRSTCEAWCGAALGCVPPRPGRAARSTAGRRARQPRCRSTARPRASRTAGLRFPLHAETLDPGSSRGISNELLGGPACVAVERGALLVIVPHALGGLS